MDSSDNFGLIMLIKSWVLQNLIFHLEKLQRDHEYKQKLAVQVGEAYAKEDFYTEMLGLKDLQDCNLMVDRWDSYIYSSISLHKYFTFLYTNNQQLTNNQTITSCTSSNHGHPDMAYATLRYQTFIFLFATLREIKTPIN